MLTFNRLFILTCIGLSIGCSNPEPYFNKTEYPDPPWVKKTSSGISIAYIPYDELPKPKEDLVVDVSNYSVNKDTAWVLVLIHEEGDADDPVLLSPKISEDLEKIIITKVNETEFNPAIQDGHPIAVWVKVPVHLIGGKNSDSSGGTLHKLFNFHQK